MDTTGIASSDALDAARALIRITRIIDSDFRASPEMDGLTVMELSALGGIDRGLDLPSVLARRLHLDPSRVTRLTDHLVAAGLIEREPVPGDRRLCRLRLTSEGTAKLTAGREKLRAIMSSLMSGLTDAERAGLELGLQGIRREAGPHESS
ncbi:MAG TPA: MarR family transcriptional regulator [Chloroflexota bacterium]|nr:MarR family transcriptional regulator [Chloroflexota bacterium]